MIEYVGSGGMMNALWSLVIVVVIVALIAGVSIGGAEFLHPQKSAADAEVRRAEAERIREQNRHDQKMNELEEQESEWALIRKQQRQEELTSLMGPISIVIMVAASVVALMLAGTICYYVLASGDIPKRGNASAVEQAALAPPSQVIAVHPTRQQPRGCVGQSLAIHPDQITYEGFLAHFFDFILHPNRSRAFYTKGIAPEVEDVYLTILTEADLIDWQSSRRTGWILPRWIRRVEDVKQQVSPRTFYDLASVFYVPDDTRERPRR